MKNQIYSSDLDQRKSGESKASRDPLGYTQPLTSLLPTSLHTFAYFDYLMLELDGLPTSRDLDFLGERSASVGEPVAMPDSTSYVRVARPQQELLCDLPPHIPITSGEITLDNVYADWPDLWTAVELIDINWTVPHHRADQPVVHDHANRYAYLARETYPDGKKRAVVPHFYVEDESRCLPGSGLPNLHLEERRHGSRATRRAGFGTTADAARFDHRAFWFDRLRLVTVDALRFGKMLARQGWTCGDMTGDDLARRLGRVHLNQFHDMQSLVDHHRLERVVIPISAEPLLPIRRRLARERA